MHDHDKVPPVLAMNNRQRTAGAPSRPKGILAQGPGAAALTWVERIGQPAEKTPAFVVGFSAEARIARASGWPVAVGGGSAAGATAAAQRLVEAGATGLVSFGLAGGLDASLPAGTVIVADAVTAGGHLWRTDTGLSRQLGGTTGHLCLGVDHVVAGQAEKRRLGRETGAAVADMESAAVAAVAAASGLPFAVLRAICDPAGRALPPAALVALDASGRIALTRVAWSVLTMPAQIPALLALAREAAVARRALRRRLATLRSVAEVR
jgi:adenosylhomocysteine nucleosidase